MPVIRSTCFTGIQVQIKLVTRRTLPPGERLSGSTVSGALGSGPRWAIKSTVTVARKFPGRQETDEVGRVT